MALEGKIMDGLTAGARIAVGSLPYLDPAEAVRAQARFFPEMPAWPQLPKKSIRETMVRQGLSGIPGLSWDEKDQPLWALSPSDSEEALELLKWGNEQNKLDRAAFGDAEAAGFSAFLSAWGEKPPASLGAVKGQCVGPVTLGLALVDENGEAVLGSKKGMEVLREYLLLHARWQVSRLSALGKPVVFFLDEPSLNGRFRPEEYGYHWKEIREWYRVFFEALQEEGVLTGLHCCGPGSWDWFFESPVEIFHVDAFRYLNQVEEQAGSFAGFIRRGGIVAWGMVPTAMSRGLFPEPAELLTRWIECFRKLRAQGLSPEEIAGRSLFSTSCGLGASPVSVAEEAGRCLDMLVSLWKAAAREGFEGMP